MRRRVILITLILVAVAAATAVLLRSARDPGPGEQVPPNEEARDDPGQSLFDDTEPGAVDEPVPPPLPDPSKWSLDELLDRLDDENHGGRVLALRGVAARGEAARAALPVIRSMKKDRSSTA